MKTNVHRVQNKKSEAFFQFFMNLVDHVYSTMLKNWLTILEKWSKIGQGPAVIWDSPSPFG